MCELIWNWGAHEEKVPNLGQLPFLLSKETGSFPS